jgi:hypothetical protein
MLYVGLDLSRQRLDVHVLDEEGRSVEVLAVHPDIHVCVVRSADRGTIFEFQYSLLAKQKAGIEGRSQTD